MKKVITLNLSCSNILFISLEYHHQDLLGMTT